jgi:hypothetical protein
MLALCAAPASADSSSTDLGPTGFGAVVVDNAGKQVLVSGPTANVVDVLDFSGNLVATIPNVYGAYGMAIDGRTLFVAESSTGAVAQINLKTLTEHKKPLLSGLDRPHWLAITHGELWVTTRLGPSCCRATLESLNLRSRVATRFPETSYFDPYLTTSPKVPNTLFLAEEGLSPGSVYKLDVSSGKPVIEASNTSVRQSNIEGLVASPDGKSVIPVAGYPHALEELHASTLTPDGVVYRGEAYATAVAVSGSPANRLATAIGPNGAGPDLSVDPLGIPAPIFSDTTTGTSGSPGVLEHGLAMSADGHTLFAVHYGETFFSGNTMLGTFTVP